MTPEEFAIIIDRLTQLENRMTTLDDHTKGIVEAFGAAEGAFKTLKWISSIIKPLFIVAAFCGSIYLGFQHQFLNK